MDEPGRPALPPPGPEESRAWLTLATVMAGFAFAGLVLYLQSPPTGTHLFAAGLLLAALVVLLNASFNYATMIGLFGVAGEAETFRNC